MAKIRFGYSDDFTARNSSVGINTTEPQQNLDVDGVAKGQDLKVTGISSFTAYEGFLRANHQIAENTTLTFDQGPVSSLSGEIIVGTGQTVTINEVVKETAGVGNNGNTLWHNLVPGGHSGIIDGGAYWNGKYFDLDGSNDVILGESCLTLFTDDTDHTLEVWVKFDDVTTRRTIISGYDSNSGTYADRWDIEVSGGKLQGGHHGAGFWTSTASVVTDTWYHLVFVHDHASSLWRVFINTATDVTGSNGGLDLTSDVLFAIGDRAESSIGHLDGQISIVRIYSKELSSTEISTNYGLGPFSKDTSVTDNLITHYNASNPSSYPGTIRDVDTTDVTRAGGSEIECLKVYNTFTPPSGGTNERPYAPKPGELYYNYDFKTIEFFDGYGWRQVDNTTRSGRAVFFGGYLGATGTTRTASMDLINIPTLGNSINFGNLESARTDTQGCSDGTRGLCAGGYFPARLTDTEYITLASAGNSIQFGDLAAARNAFGGCSSSTRGLFAGGATNTAGSPSELQIDYFQISTLGTALDFGDSATSRAGLSGGIPSSTRAVWGAGTNRVGNPSTLTAVTMMDYSTFASKGNATEFGDDILPRQTGNGCSSGTRGVFAGGYGSPAIYSSPAGRELGRKMSYITIASTGNAIEFGELSGIRTYIGSNSTSTRGIWTGGSQYPTHYDSIEYVQFSSLGNTLDFGNLHSTKGYMTGSVSDSHGGLGGF